jgi:hypothetical protein
MSKLTSCQKKSFTLKSDIYNRLALHKNKSLVVNEALKLYFHKEDYLKQAETDFWEDQIKSSEKDYKKGDFYTINPN